MKINCIILSIIQVFTFLKPIFAVDCPYFPNFPSKATVFNLTCSQACCSTSIILNVCCSSTTTVKGSTETSTNSLFSSPFGILAVAFICLCLFTSVATSRYQYRRRGRLGRFGVFQWGFRIGEIQQTQQQQEQQPTRYPNTVIYPPPNVISSTTIYPTTPVDKPPSYDEFIKNNNRQGPAANTENKY